MSARAEAEIRKHLTFPFIPFHADRPVAPRSLRRVTESVRRVTYSMSQARECGPVGAYGRHLWTEENLNLLPFGAQFLPQNIDPTQTGNKPYVNSLIVPYAGYGNITYYTPSSSSNYNSLQVTVNHRLSHGLLFGIAYTYFKAMDFADTDQVIGTPTYWSAQRNYSVAGFDQTQIFALHYTYDIPVAKSWQDIRVAKALRRTGKFPALPRS